MKKATVFFVIFLLTLVHGLALGNNVLYDDFSGESLDAEKWSGYSNNEDPIIVNGALELAISGNDSKLTNNLNFIQNRAIISIQTKVKIANESYVSSGASGKFRIGAMCYNDSHGPGSGQSYNQNEGNVWADFRLVLDDSHTLKAVADISRINDAEDTSETTLFYKEFNTIINFDTEYTMSMGVEDGIFVLTLGSETYSYAIETPMYIPYNGGQMVTSRLYLDQGEQGLFKAILDDVMVTYDESDNTFLVGSIVNSRWGTGSDYNTWATIEVFKANESFKENIESITITTPSGETLPYTKDDFEFFDYGSSFEYGIYDIPGQPEIGTYTFTIVANGVTYTGTDTQYQNHELPIPDISAFHIDGQTFSWDLVDYEEDIPLYYRFRLYDANGNRLVNTGHIQDMNSFTFEYGQLTMGEAYRMYVRVSDSDDWYQVQNNAYSQKTFTFEPSRSISGTVSGDDDNTPDTPNVPVAGMHIQVFSDACNWIQIGWGNTDINGNYTVSGLPVGTDVYVKTCTECNNADINYINAYYDTNSLNCNEATPITITEENTPDINFNLAPGGTISGRLLDPDGNPIQNINVNLNDAPCGGQWLAGTATDDQGYFEIKGVPDITVYLNTYSPHENLFDFANKYYAENTGTFDCMSATPIYVEPLHALSNIDMILEPAGSVSGQIIDQNGNPIPNFNVYADDASCGGHYLSGTITDESGNFIIRSVPAGMDVYIWTGGYSDSPYSPYIGKVWDGNNGSADCNDGLALDVIPQQDNPGINMVLDFDTSPRNYDASGDWLFDVTLYSTENLDDPDWNEETTWQSRMQGRHAIEQDNSTFSLDNWFYGNVYDSSNYQHYEVVRDAGGSTELTMTENDPTSGWIHSDFHTIWFDIDIDSEELEGEFILTFWKILPGSTADNILIDEENPTHVKCVFTGIKLNPEPVVLLASNPNFTVTSDNSPALIYGTDQANQITLESGVYAELVNFPGSNTVTIQSDSGIFSVSRSGATVTFEGPYGTMLKIPATETAQTIVFDDKSFTLKIDAGSVMLDSQVIGTTGTSL